MTSYVLFGGARWAGSEVADGAKGTKIGVLFIIIIIDNGWTDDERVSQQRENLSPPTHSRSWAA